MKNRLLGALLLSACATSPENRPAKPVAALTETKKFVVDSSKPMPPGLDESAMNLQVDPCTDFYEYACGGWLARVGLPSDRVLYSRGFVAIADRNELALKEIAEQAAAGTLAAKTPFATQLGDAYASCMDEAALEQALPEVRRFIDANSVVKTPGELARVLATLHAAGYRPFFSVGAQQDFTNSGEVVVGLDQGGLGLPDRDFYLDETDRAARLRTAYLAHVEKIFTLSGEPAGLAKKSAESVLALETRLAKVSLSRIDRRDPRKLSNRVDRVGLREKWPDFPWDAWFEMVGLHHAQAVNVTSLAWFTQVSTITRDTPREVLRAYLAWVVLRGSIPALPKAFQEAQFAFASENFTGAKEDRPRWKKCIAFVDGELGEALGREFTRRHFPEASKARAIAMVAALQGSFERNLASLEWMDDETRATALAKVRAMVNNNKIGYPDAWRDYSPLETDRKSFFKTSLATSRFETARQFAKIGRPVDRAEWLLSPPTVNAYNEGQKNEIVFPAGILQPPFFDQAATDAVNFGAMGMVVGHEITHGFDDEGRQFDAEGNLRDWWSAASTKAFVSRVACVKKQFDGYEGVGELKVRGDLTLGENVADLGGLTLAHAAMIDWYVRQANAPESFRYDRSQQFFLGFAQAWCTTVRPQLAKLRLATDPHAPSNWRVNGPLGNLDAFKTAFRCADDAKMIRSGADRCSVW